MVSPRRGGDSDEPAASVYDLAALDAHAAAVRGALGEVELCDVTRPHIKSLGELRRLPGFPTGVRTARA